MSIELVSFSEEHRPTRAYLVCATPRSGSTLLCELLRETGRAGTPLEHFEYLRHSSLPRQPREYFSEMPAPEVIDLLPPLEPGERSEESPAAWWERIVAEGSGQNGVWGGKLMWGHVEDFVARARELPGLEGAELGAVVHELLGDPVFVYVTRRDKVAQAVSLWRALQTQSWRAGDREDTEPGEYHFGAIEHLVLQLEADDRAWTEWFARTGIEPLQVSYEQLDAAPIETAGSVLSALGLDRVQVTVPRLARQRDERSAAWMERYRDEAGQAA